jgi:hypothetical protein
MADDAVLTTDLRAVGYDEDFSLWSRDQARLLEERRYDALDLENLVEEVASLGRNDRRELKSRMEVLLMHLLKWKFQPEQLALSRKSWRQTISEQRSQIRLVLEDSPSLQRSLRDSDWTRSVWNVAVVKAADETDLELAKFPEEPIWSVDQILAWSFYPE